MKAFGRLPVAAAIAFASIHAALGAACTATFQPDIKAGLLTVDISSVPRDATIFRAELVLRLVTGFTQRSLAQTNVHIEGETIRGAEAPRLQFVAPRFAGLDALEAVQAAHKAGKPLTLKIVSTAAGVSHLEVSYVGGRPRTEAIPAATGVQAVHRKGQTLITFSEPRVEPIPEFKTGADVKAFTGDFAKKHPGLALRIWRSAEKITPETIAKARLVGECGFFSCWNATYHQDETGRKPPVLYRVSDLGEPLAWGTGVYAHNPAEAGKAFYAVTVAVNGEEDFSQLAAAAEPVEEVVGQGEPVLQWIEEPDPKDGWQYRRGKMARLIYTRWEAWPHSSVPNNPIDYLVVLPLQPKPERPGGEAEYNSFRVDPAPVGLHLHCWGGSLNGGYGWWYNAHRGAVLIASNQIPYDWWTGYHESRGTAKSFGDGHVQPFTMNRMFAFLDWAAKQHAEAPEKVRALWPRLDLTRVFTAGNSMGASGAPMYAIRHGDRIAWAIGWVGIHVPELSPGFKGSYENSYGRRDPAITMPDGKTSPWDYFSDVWWMKQNPKAETGLIIASNGKNDGGIGWPQAVQFARTLQETRRPHIYNWGLGGHGTRTIIGSNFDQDVRTDQSLPAFTNCSLDDNIGTATPKPKEQLEAEQKQQQDEVAAKKRREVIVDPYDGDPQGAYNAWLRWRTDDIVDTVDAWELTVILLDKAPKDACTVDLTPRRLQKFRTPSSARFAYTVTEVKSGKELASGAATADEHDLLTLKQIPLAKGENRVKVLLSR
ncbi:MAG TPA: hypothetical protein PLE19_07360 [Planctomycetota bacterium]|nr:hypothetical protein [Planctomycetota bacterium]HRR79336.1 hypothetical protein [Planctomycetota bacterium]HRT96958.1 hypothetical protein [Planctomycetota bacterium]